MIHFKTPKFWYGITTPKTKILSSALSPLGKLYGWIVQNRFDMYYPVPMSRPIICVGNIVAGGAGKTPVVMAIVDLLHSMERNPHIVTRGYGGTEKGPIQVAPNRDTAADVGDEALLLVDKAPTWVSRNRALGALEAFYTGASVVVMDDGFQNPVIYKDFSIVVIDGAVGFGNGQVMPAGPLRESLDGLSRAHMIVIVGDDQKHTQEKIKKHTDAPVVTAQLIPHAGQEQYKDTDVYAFAGIGRPEKFKETLEDFGAEVKGFGDFPDHCAYREEDLKELLESAQKEGCPVLTTAKDYVRLPASIKEQVSVFGVTLAFDDVDQVSDIMEAYLPK